MKVFLICVLVWWAVSGLAHLFIALRYQKYPRVVVYSRKADVIGGVIRIALAGAVVWVVWG